MTKQTQTIQKCPTTWNPLNVRSRTKNYKKFTLPSQFIPDQTMSMRELLNRHASGVTLTGFEPIYNDDEESMGINISTLDLTEIEELKKNNTQRLRELQNKFTTEQEEKIQKMKERQDRVLEEAFSKFKETLTIEK